MEALRKQVLELQAKVVQGGGNGGGGGSPFASGEKEHMEAQLRERESEIRALNEKLFQLSQAAILAPQPQHPQPPQEPQRSVEEWQALTQACSELEEELGRRDVRLDQLQAELTAARQEVQHLNSRGVAGGVTTSLPPHPVQSGEIEKLKAELQETKKTLLGVDSEKRDLDGKNRVLQREVEELQREVNEAKEKVAKLEEESALLAEVAAQAGVGGEKAAPTPSDNEGDDTEYLENRISQLEATIAKLEAELEVIISPHSLLLTHSILLCAESSI